MLSPSQNHQSHHRRQQSSPLAFNADMATEYFPITCPQPINSGASHRRGLSLDQSMRLQDPTHTNPGNRTVSNNQGFQQQQTMREAQMPGMSQPGQFKNLEDIFEIPSGIVKSEKKFPDFGPLGIEEPTSGSIEGLMEVSIGTPFLPPSNQSRPRTPANQLMNSKLQFARTHDKRR